MNRWKNDHIYCKFTESKKNLQTTTWYTHPQSGVNQGQVHTDHVKATEVTNSAAVKNGKKPKKVQPEGTVEYKVSLIYILLAYIYNCLC